MTNKDAPPDQQKPRPNSPRTSLAAIRCNIEFKELQQKSTVIQNFFHEQFNDIVINGPTKDEIRAYPELFRTNQEQIFYQCHKEKLETLERLKNQKRQQFYAINNQDIPERQQVSLFERRRSQMIDVRKRAYEKTQSQSQSLIRSLNAQQSMEQERQLQIQMQQQLYESSLEKTKQKLQEDQLQRELKQDEYLLEMEQFGSSKDLQLTAVEGAAFLCQDLSKEEQLLLASQMRDQRSKQVKQKLDEAQKKQADLDKERMNKFIADKDKQSQRFENSKWNHSQSLLEKQRDRAARQEELSNHRYKFTREQEKRQEEIVQQQQQRAANSLQNRQKYIKAVEQGQMIETLYRAQTTKPQDRSRLSRLENSHKETDAMYRVKVNTAKDTQCIDTIVKQQQITSNMLRSNIQFSNFKNEQKRSYSSMIDRQTNKILKNKMARDLLDAKYHYSTLMQSKKTEFKQNYLRFENLQRNGNREDFQHKQNQEYYEIDKFISNITEAEREEASNYYQSKYLSGSELMLVDRLAKETQESKIRDMQEISKRLYISLEYKSKAERSKQLQMYYQEKKNQAKEKAFMDL